MAGFLTITGGKWTTFRLMAETTMDKACEQLGVTRPCKTAETTVPGGISPQGHYWLGHRLHEVEEHHLQSELICECELVTRTMLENAAAHNPTLTLDDLRRDVRLGMGPCQGGFCTYRAAGILHEMGKEDKKTRRQENEVSEWDVANMQSPERNILSAIGSPQSAIPISQSPNLLLRDFLQERWKGLTAILWGQQLKQERLDELIYLSIMNADHLPVDGEPSPMTQFYEHNPVAETHLKREKEA
ncbi:MAG: (2Fe-2S)-binding protein [Caldilineaceae bacterium]